MFELKVVKAWRKAIAREENWQTKTYHPDWNFVEADMWIETKPATAKQEETINRMFDDLVGVFLDHYGSAITYQEWVEENAKVDAEYAELFGITVEKNYKKVAINA
jgi:hypothetical protein